MRETPTITLGEVSRIVKDALDHGYIPYLMINGEYTEIVAEVKKPCIGCIYADECGNTNRTQSCKGRQTKSQKSRR